MLASSSTKPSTALAIVAMILVGSFMAAGLASFQEVRDAYRPSDVWILDRHGVPLESVRERLDRRSLDWTKLGEVSPAFIKTLVRVEDKRFYNHPGVDFSAVLRALVGRLTGVRRGGGSTLTMQVVNLLSSKRSENRYLRKLQQFLLALKLERSWSKEQILETYINLIPFRGELIGLRAASIGYFEKSPVALDESESAVLIALIRSPNASPAAIVRRSCEISRREVVHQVDCEKVKSLVSSKIEHPYQIARPRDRIPVLAKSFFASTSPPGVIATTLDARLQEIALHSLREQMRELRSKNVNDGAVLVLDTKTGQALAYVANAGRGYTSAEQIDGVQMRRQAGSTIKPFIYGTAFDLNLLHMDSLILDSPENLSVGEGRVYHPQNYDLQFRGLVSASEALASSLNVPAVRTLQMVGESRVIDRLQRLGFRQLKNEDYYGPSLALGTVDVSLWELAQGFRRLSIFAREDESAEKDGVNTGFFSGVFSEATKLKIFASLALADYRRLTFGTESILSLPFPAAVKTGTSKDMRDNWCIGFTSEFTVAVWVGNFDGASMWNVSGITGAAPIWHRLMLALHKTPPLDEPANYIPPAQALAHSTLTRIRYPAEGMLIGLDPDIPTRLQKLPIQVDQPQSGQWLYLNDQRLGAARDVSFWSIKKGRYRLQLRASNGAVVDARQFSVR